MAEKCAGRSNRLDIYGECPTAPKWRVRVGGAERFACGVHLAWVIRTTLRGVGEARVTPLGKGGA